MDSAQVIALKAEINALPTFLNTYNLAVVNYLNGTIPTCPHILDIINSLSYDMSLQAAYDGSWSGQGLGYGVITDFTYYVHAIHRNIAIFSSPKAAYYAENDSNQVSENNYEVGEAGKIISYMQGNSPEQGVII